MNEYCCILRDLSTGNPNNSDGNITFTFEYLSVVSLFLRYTLESSTFTSVLHIISNANSKLLFSEKTLLSYLSYSSFNFKVSSTSASFK